MWRSRKKGPVTAVAGPVGARRWHCDITYDAYGCDWTARTKKLGRRGCCGMLVCFFGTGRTARAR